VLALHRHGPVVAAPGRCEHRHLLRSGPAKLSNVGLSIFAGGQGQLLARAPARPWGGHLANAYHA
jgi:hypothetical protein